MASAEASLLAEALERALAAADLPEAEYDGAGRRICIDCGERISLRRLRAVPKAVRCTACQAEAER